MQLLLLRHAKSSWSDPSLPDEDRPLAPRGEKAADRIRDYIAAEVLEPRLVLCSSALRARQTLARVLPALGAELQVQIDLALYTFEADVLLDRLGRIPSDMSSVLLVGHNPAMQGLVARVADRGDALADALRKYPTAGLAEITFGDRTWGSLAEKPGELVRFIAPRVLTE
jgi:phosphohistidine phosphatase